VLLSLAAAASAAPHNYAYGNLAYSGAPVGLATPLATGYTGNVGYATPLATGYATPFATTRAVGYATPLAAGYTSNVGYATPLAAGYTSNVGYTGLAATRAVGYATPVRLAASPVPVGVSPAFAVQAAPVAAIRYLSVPAEVRTRVNAAPSFTPISYAAPAAFATAYGNPAFATTSYAAPAAFATTGYGNPAIGVASPLTYAATVGALPASYSGELKGLKLGKTVLKDGGKIVLKEEEEEEEEDEEEE